MENIKSLLTNTSNPQVQMMQTTRGLVTKWDKTGLLEGIKSDTEKSNMSVLLENQALQLINEATSTGTSANSEQWAGVALPLVRRVFAEFAAKEFVSVQPMNLPSGLVFYLDFKYGTNQSVFTAQPSSEDSLFGGVSGSGDLYNSWKLGSTNAPVGGLYVPGRYAYSINDTASIVAITVASASFGDINFDSGNSNDPIANSLSTSFSTGNLFVVTTAGLTVTASQGGSYPDLNAVRSFMPINAGKGYTFQTWFPGFSRFNGPEAVFGRYIPY